MSKKSQADRKTAVTMFNTKMDALRTERDTLLDRIKKLEKKSKDQAKSSKVQINLLMKNRDVTRKKLKTLSGNSLTDKEKISTLSKQVKKLTKTQEKIQIDYEVKASQVIKQAAQVYFFRGELLRFKKELSLIHISEPTRPY